MATRNLTAEFNKYRQASSKKRMNIPSASTSLMGDQGYEAPEISNNPLWVDDIEKLRALLDEIEKKIGALELVYKDRLAAVFDDKIREYDTQISNLTGNMTRSFRKCEVTLSKIKDQRYKNDTEARIFGNIQKGLAGRLQDLSMSFRKNQKRFFAKLRSMDASVDDPDMIETGFNQSQKGAMDMMKKEVQSREQEIAQIAKGAQELAQIFKDLNQLVIEQGTIVDRIDYNMDQAVTKVKEGLVEVHKAEEHKKASRPGWIIFYLVLIIVIMIIINIVKYAAKKKTGS